MHKRPLAHGRADFEGFNLYRTALDIELGGELTGTDQRVV